MQNMLLSNSSQQKSKPNSNKDLSQFQNRIIDEKIKSLTKRFDRENLSNMNPKLYFKLDFLIKNYQEFKDVESNNDLKKIIQQLPYFTMVNMNQKQEESQKLYDNQVNDRNQGHHQNQRKNLYLNNNKKMPIQSQSIFLNPSTCHIKLTYPNMQRTVIITGIKKSFMQQALKQFNHNTNNSSYNNDYSYNHHNHNSHNHNYKRYCSCVIVGENEYWIAIQADTSQNAFNFKRFVRNKKKYMDEKNIYTYKQEKKRVRIVMQNQDFYTLLVDAMTQKKNMQFCKRLVHPKSGLFPQLFANTSYRTEPYPNQQYQSNLKRTNKVLYFPYINLNWNSNQLKQDYHMSIDEVYSEDLSKTSDAFDKSMMNDLIQTNDMGIQSENIFNFQQDENYNQHQHHQHEHQHQHYQHDQNDPNDQENCLQVNENQYQHDQQKNVGEAKQDPQKQSAGSIQDDNLNNFEESSHSIRRQFVKQKPQIQSKQPKTQNTLIKGPLILYFQRNVQTDRNPLNYTKMKRFQAQYKKRMKGKIKLVAGLPEEFRQISDEQKNRGLFFHNLFKSMQRKTEKKQHYNDFF